MVAKKAKTTPKKAAVKKPRTPSIKKQIIASVLEVCANSNSDIMLLEMTDSYALIIKRVSATTFYVQNAGAFCPRDKYIDKEFFVAFYVVWGNIGIPGEYFIPEIRVSTPGTAEGAILSYDGETIHQLP